LRPAADTQGGTSYRRPSRTINPHDFSLPPSAGRGRRTGIRRATGRGSLEVPEPAADEETPGSRGFLGAASLSTEPLDVA